MYKRAHFLKIFSRKYIYRAILLTPLALVGLHFLRLPFQLAMGLEDDLRERAIRERMSLRYTPPRLQIGRSGLYFLRIDTGSQTFAEPSHRLLSRFRDDGVSFERISESEGELAKDHCGQSTVRHKRSKKPGSICVVSTRWSSPFAMDIAVNVRRNSTSLGDVTSTYSYISIGGWWCLRRITSPQLGLPSMTLCA